ncbi:MAG: hypothetical protein ACPG6B_07265 [Oceanihabitans sp.]
MKAITLLIAFSISIIGFANNNSTKQPINFSDLVGKKIVDLDLSENESQILFKKNTHQERWY